MQIWPLRLGHSEMEASLYSCSLTAVGKLTHSKYPPRLHAHSRTAAGGSSSSGEH